MAKAEIGLSDSTRLRTQFYYITNQTTLTFRSGLWAYDLWIANTPTISWHTQALDYQFQINSQLLDDLLLIGGGYVHYTFLTYDNAVLNDDDELRGAFFVQAQYSLLDTLQLTGGVRLDMNTDTKLALSPRAVAVFRPWSEQAFRASYGLAFRKPSFYESRVHLEITDFNPAMPEIVQKLAEALGNEDLENEQVHSFEAGWLGRFLDERLRVSVDLFYNIYLNTTIFVVDIPLRMGAPDILNSTLQFENSPEEIHAYGGETEVAWKFNDDWSAWCNLGLRKVTSVDTDEELETEPTLRVNLGGRYLPPDGWLVDVALHYVSSYSVPLVNPASTLDPPELMPLGDRFLLFGRIGYRVKVFGDMLAEAGLTIRAPLGEPFREWAGIARPPHLVFDTDSDFGGERVARLVALYLRGSF
jgi:outer membrane receptor protein involved in Fe transport